MTFWLTMNSLGLAAIGVILYLVLRQLGFVLHRVAPVGARSTSEGPRIGENLLHPIPQLGQGEFIGKSKLIVFVSEECFVCAAIKRGAEVLASSWMSDARILLIHDCPAGAQPQPLQSLAPGLFEMRDCGLRQQLGASFVPFAIVTDRAGTVVGKALVNEIAHLESLLELERTQATAPATGPLLQTQAAN